MMMRPRFFIRDIQRINQIKPTKYILYYTKTKYPLTPNQLISQ